MAADTTRLTIELELLLRNLNRTLRGLSQVEQRLRRVASINIGSTQAQASQRAASSVQRLALAQQRLQLQQQRLQLQQQRLNVATQQVANAQGRAALAAQRLAAAQQRVTTTATAQVRALQATQRHLNSLGAAALRVGGGLRSVGASAAILVTGPLVALGTIAARSAADIDTIRNRLIATEGSLTAANERLIQLRQLADSSIGVTRRAALDTFSFLATIGNLTDDTINRQIKALGRLNAAFTIDDQQLFFRNLVQIFQQGFEIKDIREALGRVPIFNALLQSAFGTSDPERLRELKAAGKLTLDTFLSGLAGAVETDPVLGDIGEAIRVRFQKTIERITDSLEPLGRAILGPLERIINRAEPIILRIANAFGSLPEGIQTAIVALGIFTAAIGPLLFILGGISSGIGALATALAALVPIISTIGLPALAAIVGGLTVLVGELSVAVIALAVAWKKNFLGVQELVISAANAVISAFTRIRKVFDEAIRRILPTLRSITGRTLAFVTDLWQRHGQQVVAAVRGAFDFVVSATEVVLRTLADLVDLLVKLVDGDWQGAWNAFARIVVRAIDIFDKALNGFLPALARVFIQINLFLARQAIRFTVAGQILAARLVLGIVDKLRSSGPTIRDALIDMFLLAAQGFDPASIAGILVARIVAALRRAAAVPLPPLEGPTVGADVGGEAFRIGATGRPRRPVLDTETEDEKSRNILRRQLEKLREAQDKLQEAREEAALNQLRSRIETEFNATRAGLDREAAALEGSFDERLTALKDYLKQRAALENAQIDAEIVKELELTSVLFSELGARRQAIEREFKTELKDIEADPRLKGRAREAAIQTAELKKAAALEKAISEFRIKHFEAGERVNQLEKDRTAVVEALLRLERQLTREIELQQTQLRADLLEQQGRTADAETLRLKARFTETLRDLRLDLRGLGADLQTALNNVDLAVLQEQLDQLPEPVRVLVELLDIGIKRANITEAQRLVDDLSAQLRLDEQRIQNRVLDGLINQRQAQAEIVALQEKYRGVLLDVLRGELAKAEAIKDQGQIIAIQAQIAEVERLGQAIDEVGVRINQALFSDLQAGLSGIFSGARKGFEGLRDAAISFGERLLDTLNDIAATSILQQIEELFKPDATNTKGTIGGFISKLFGLAPKSTDIAAVAGTTLATAATAAATTLQTGATAAAATNTAAAATSAATLTTGIATALTAFTTGITAAATAFASAVVAAGAAFAAAVGAAAAAQSATSGLAAAGSGIGNFAVGNLIPARRGGVLATIAEGGYPEAVLTTDPKYATRQLAILRQFLRHTRGLGGRIREFASGAFISPSEAQSMMLSEVAGPSVPSGDVGSFAVAGAPSTMRLRQVLVDQRSYRDWVTSSEGEEVLVDFLYKHQPVIRKIGGGRR